MKTFKNYLMARGLAKSSARSYVLCVKQFLDWVKLEELQEHLLNGKDVMNYLQFLKARGLTQKSLRHHLSVLRQYFRYKGYSLGPLAKLKIKGIHQELPEQLLSEAELLKVYGTFPIQIELDRRDKSMLGLLVFQGLTTRELVDLDLNDVNLEGQTIEVRATRITSGRRLVLRDIQIEDLQNYQKQLRPELLALKPNKTEQFFLTNGVSEKRNALQNGIQRMSDQLKKRISFYKNTRQLRASVISNWLLNSSLRQVQYMAGHKYISSTERYQLGRIMEVEEALLKFHPNK